MTSLLRERTPVHSNPPPSPGPYLRALGLKLGYPQCNLTEAAGDYARLGTVASLVPEAIDLEDVDALETACEADGPREPHVPFPEWIETQASWFRSLGSDAAEWLAAELQQLADLARTLRADTPEQLTDRRDTLAYERLQGAQPW
jgi:hypothetical protein